jgi:dihydroorotate dehydrogenase electron transfer subunit
MLATIKENTEITSGIYRLALVDSDVAGTVASVATKAIPGQFVNVYLNSKSMLLPRPFGISDVLLEDGEMRLVIVYAVVGEGTAELSSYSPGVKLRILGPQGNGYDLDGLGRSVLLIGGGLGVPPLLFAARRIRERLTSYDATTITALLGYRDDPYYLDEMRQYCDDVFRISEFGPSCDTAEKSGPRDMNGTVVDLAARLVSEGRIDISNASILSCGPTPMLRAVAGWAKARSVPAQVSLEARMGCGYGACVGCTIEIRQATHHNTVRRKICKDGPVFPADAVVWT